MRKAWVVVLLLSLITTGCRGGLPFSELEAVKHAGDYYKRLCPGGGTLNILSTMHYSGGILVLGKKTSGAKALTVELILIDRDGAAKVATGLPAGKDPFSVNSVSDGSKTILFGHYNEDWGERKQVVKAVMTLNNWSMVDALLTDDPGFIIVLDRFLRVEKFNLSTDDSIVPKQHVPVLIQSSFIDAGKLPLPHPLSENNLVEVEVRDRRFGIETTNVVPLEYKGLKEFIAAFNSGLKKSKRAPEAGKPRFTIVVKLDGDREVAVWETEEASVHITYSQNGHINGYLTEQGDLYRIINAWKNAPWKSPDI